MQASRCSCSRACRRVSLSAAASAAWMMIGSGPEVPLPALFQRLLVLPALHWSSTRASIHHRPNVALARFRSNTQPSRRQKLLNYREKKSRNCWKEKRNERGDEGQTQRKQRRGTKREKKRMRMGKERGGEEQGSFSPLTRFELCTLHW